TAASTRCIGTDDRRFLRFLLRITVARWRDPNIQLHWALIFVETARLTRDALRFSNVIHASIPLRWPHLAKPAASAKDATQSLPQGLRRVHLDLRFRRRYLPPPEIASATRPTISCELQLAQKQDLRQSFGTNPHLSECRSHNIHRAHG